MLTAMQRARDDVKGLTKVANQLKAKEKLAGKVVNTAIKAHDALIGERRMALDDLETAEKRLLELRVGALSAS